MEQSNDTAEFSSNTSILLSNDFFEEERSILPQWAVYLYFIFICLGAVVNLVHFLVLARCRKNGALSIIMQLTAVDCCSLYIAMVEILTLNNQTWIFSSGNCPLFNGTEVILNSLVIWLIICLNFHVVSMWNLYRDQIEKKNANPLTSCEDQSNECLVTKKENANRTVNIDYSKRKTDVSALIPAMLIVFVCLSLSIPNFTLSSIIRTNRNQTLCTIMDHYYGHTLQKLLFLFSSLVPVPLLLFTFLILVIKLVQTSPKDIDNILIQKLSEIRGLLVCSVAVTMLYIILSFQRNLFHFLHIMSHDFDKNSTIILQVPPLYNSKLNKSSNIYLSMLHYCGITGRAVLYSFTLPKFQNLLKSSFYCLKSKK